MYFFGDIYKKKRIINEQSKEVLANYLGIRRHSVSRWGNNIALPSLEYLLDLSEFSEVSLEKLLGNLKCSLTRRSRDKK